MEAKDIPVVYRDPATIIVPERMRKEYGDVQSLADSMKEFGQIHPIRITSGLVLVAGGRRLEAAKIGKLQVATLEVDNLSPLQLKEIELRENLDRKDMTWQERDNAIAELHTMKQRELGTANSGGSSVGHSLADTADLINASKGLIKKAVDMSAAMRLFPMLADCTSHNEAQKKLDKIKEKLAIAELAKRKKESGAKGFIQADQHFIVRDAFEGMSSLPAESVDFINCDTPYGIDLTSQKKIQTDTRTDEDYKEWSTDSYVPSIKKILVECFRVLKNDRWMMFWFGQEWYFEVREAIKEAGFKVDKIPACWYGGPGAAQTIAVEVNLGRSYEQFFVCRKGDPILLKRGRPNVFAFDKASPQNKIHPTEKPLPLMSEILETFVVPGHICLSPFIGSGNDLRAAYKHGCMPFGFDLNEDVKNKFLLRVEADQKEGLYGSVADSKQ